MPGGGRALFHEAEIAKDHGQQIVEIVGDARGQLADRLQALHLPQGRLDVFALLDLIDELTIGCGQFRRPLGNARFQFLVEPAALILPLRGRATRFAPRSPRWSDGTGAPGS